MVKVVNKLACNLELDGYNIEAGSFIDLAKDEANKLIKLYPHFLEIKKTKKKNDKDSNS